MTTDREACGRCSMSTAVDVASAGREEGDGSDRDPFGDARIEVDERQLRAVSPGAWLSRISDRVGSSVDRLTWGDR
ncbi:hypothetical protein [Natrarchaeobaculum sulfurireducens]|uniref:Uncharacterized protein n=1 Tax=Natrarchaeobaculum sulfurireducens TaxID=2044521 RepID=A0A346PT94_9EURY|nr:hypothetical protein [Natrarchaeobaculum sulfurireducens]AXR77298.1 hypothetical protein AArc1_0957 [Natrarchaeobaculum sulfurireducens]AXR82739.1 hypothetical protein AArcMg_2749 [Natrarchaeobaculum sulfurireducens]